jgi:ubiquinone/menaquinone biosynthesis C-methylase UbiE
VTTGDASRANGPEVARYDGAATSWATGAAIVYAPLAVELVNRAPHPLADRLVLDVGAGTGVGSTALRASGARPIALDLSHDMLSWERARRPPAVVASVLAVPAASQALDDVFASFVLNHLADPVAAMRELARPIRRGGAFLATTFSEASSSRARDLVDEVATEHGWRRPDWYVAMKERIIPLLGSAHAMEEAAVTAGLERVVVDEVAIDVGVHRADQLVDYRLGQVQVSGFLNTLARADREALRIAAIAAVEPVMEPYCPVVIFLSACVA